MRRKSLFGLMLSVFVALLLPGCDPPNHLDAPPSGHAMYFAMSVLPQYRITQGSQLYAFDIEGCRLRMLSDHSGMNTWVSASPDGKQFAYTRCHSQSHFTLHVQHVGDTNARQLGAAHKAYAAPRYVPGKSPHILAYTGRAMSTLEWVFFDASGREMSAAIPGAPKAIGTDRPAVSTDRVAVPVYGMIKEHWKTGQKPYGVRLYVIDLSSGAPKATEVALFDVHHHETQVNFLNSPTIDLAFSPDAGKLIMSWYRLDKTRFYELDVSGKTPPKVLFTDKNAWGPQWAGDGRHVVYMRKHPTTWNRLEAVVRDVPGGTSKVFATVPGQVRGAGNTFRRLSNGKTRLAHFADEGITVVDVDADGSNPATRVLSRDILNTQKTLAAFEYVFNQNRKTNQYRAPYPVMKHFYKMKKVEGEKREDQVARALTTAWQASTAWRPGDAVAHVGKEKPTVPTPGPKPPARGKQIRCPHCGKLIFIPD